ncbi:MAG: sucrose phosphorylase [Anaerolineae bacterium]|nr:sucrose phosphorylase [Anaerolineae bacterium]
MRNCVHLITYANRLGGDRLEDLQRLLDGPLKGVFGGVHVLPFFYPIDGADAGFDPIDHSTIDPQVGTWDDIAAMSDNLDMTADLIVNHISSKSRQFQDFLMHGGQSLYSGMFLTFASVFPDGATEAQLLRIYRPRPGLPFTTISLSNGEKSILWTTFTNEQIDLNVQHPQGNAYWKSILQTFQEHGITTIRLDAVGYAIKKPGTSCFMIAETFEFINEITQYARSLGLEVLVEIHAHYRKQIEIARQVDRVYDFALPPLILHAIFNRTARHLKAWLAISPRNAVTVLDTHDGIGVIDIGPAADASGSELPGLIPSDELDLLVETIHEKSGGQSRHATGHAASNLDIYQINCTYYDALGRNDRDYLIARAIQFFAPGIPQMYYVGLLAGTNDMALLEKTKIGRDINRHYYSWDEVHESLARTVVKDMLKLIRFRSEHPAFQGTFSLLTCDDSLLITRWDYGATWAQLKVDFSQSTLEVLYVENAVEQRLDFKLTDI